MVLSWASHLGLVLACTACDGALSIKGTVVTAPGLKESRVYVDQQAPELSGVQPLGSAIVRVIESPGRSDSLWRGTDTTTAAGAFSYFSVTCPCQFPVEVSISRPGYIPVTDTFMHRSSEDHAVMVLLAPGGP
jgi:hypothetical protein